MFLCRIRDALYTSVAEVCFDVVRMEDSGQKMKKKKKKVDNSD